MLVVTSQSISVSDCQWLVSAFQSFWRLNKTIKRKRLFFCWNLCKVLTCWRIENRCTSIIRYHRQILAVRQTSAARGCAHLLEEFLCGGRDSLRSSVHAGPPEETTSFSSYFVIFFANQRLEDEMALFASLKLSKWRLQAGKHQQHVLNILQRFAEPYNWYQRIVESQTLWICRKRNKKCSNM